MTEAKQNKDQNFAVLSAMLKAGLKPKSKLSATEYARHLAVEKALQQAPERAARQCMPRDLYES
jgi:hypothetical protein